MTTYNVAVPVVELIEADSPEAAIGKLSDRLSAAGFWPYDHEVSGFDAFETEPTGGEVVAPEN